MRPKEKAEELINKFLRIEDDSLFYWEPYYDKRYTDDEVLPHAKKCALICVEEILSDDEINNNYAYWEKVKKELEAYGST